MPVERLSGKKRRKYQKLLMLDDDTLFVLVEIHLREQRCFPVVLDVSGLCHQQEMCWWLHRAQTCASPFLVAHQGTKSPLRRDVFTCFQRAEVQQVAALGFHVICSLQPRRLISTTAVGARPPCPRVVALQLGRWRGLFLFRLGQTETVCFWFERKNLTLLPKAASASAGRGRLLS